MPGRSLGLLRHTLVVVTEARALTGALRQTLVVVPEARALAGAPEAYASGSDRGQGAHWGS